MLQISAALRLSFKKLAAYGNLHFTRRQLYYEVCRTIRQPKGVELKTAAAVFATSCLPSLGLMLRRRRGLAAGLFAASAVFTSGLVWLRSSAHTLAPPISFDDFENALDDYLQHQPRPIGLLDEKTNSEDVLPDSYPIDLPRYGLHSLLICESSQVAQMLRRNNFHLEASCAILDAAENAAENAAPLNEIYRQMLACAAEPRVYFLHDAGLAGFSRAANLRERLALPRKARLQILGLRPAHAERLHLFVEQNDLIEPKTLGTLGFLSEDDKRWLAAGQRAEVAAVHPVRLLRVLRRLILGLPVPQNAWKISLPPRDLGFM